MKETRFAIVLTAAAIAGACFGQEAQLQPPVPPVPQAATDAEGLRGAQSRLAELKSLRTKTTLLCGTSLQFPFYHFAVMPSHNAADMGEQWNMAFGSLAPYALANADLAAEMFAEGASLFAEMEDGEARQEFARQFQSFGENAIEQTCQALCKDQPAQVVPYLKQLISSKAVTARFGDKLATLPASPLASVRPEFLGQLVRNLQPVLAGEGAGAEQARAFEAAIIAFLAEEDIPDDVRDALLDTLLAPAFARAGVDAPAFRKLLADAKGLRARLPNAASQESLDQRIHAFGEKMVEQTYQAISTNGAAEVVAYLKTLAETKALTARFGKDAALVTFATSEFPPLGTAFIGKLVAKAYPVVTGEGASAGDVATANAVVVQLFQDGLAGESASALLDAFADKSVARAQNSLAGALQFVETAEKVRAALPEGDMRDSLDRRCRQFARKSTVKTFRAICPAQADAVLPYLQNLADTLTLRLLYDGKLTSLPKGHVTALPVDLVGQLAEDAFIRLAGTSAPSPENIKHLNALLDFTAKLLPRLSEGAQQSLLDRRLDGFFLTGNYDGAIALLDKGLPSHTPAWCKGTAAKLRYHRLLAAGQKDAALKQLHIFIDFMQSDEQKDFEDCDPTTGIIYSREWVLGKNYVRCWELARDLKDSTLETEYFKKAKELYAIALKKAKDDPKALAELNKEAQAVGL
ncbi:MAG: hypothetical protein J6V72_04405 [Kiritimatiellae bacterium]|nr:hypothetical protein [Kiritimatiellia bacterium]